MDLQLPVDSNIHARRSMSDWPSVAVVMSANMMAERIIAFALGMWVSTLWDVRHFAQKHVRT
jgi:lambda repressor-like predicted transcriptional regulator